MTDPDAPLPANWKPQGCRFLISTGTFCGQPGATVDGHNGSRCELHPAEFDVDRAVEIAAKGWPGIALAYIRAWGETA